MLVQTLILEGNDPTHWGHQHGEVFKEEIRELYKIRLELTLAKTRMGNEAKVLEVAKAHLPVLRAFDEPLANEMRGIAEASGLTEAQILLVNHYTDLRDIDRIPPQPTEDPGGCSAFFVPSSTGPVLGQTWDMHASATEHVIMLQVPSTHPDDHSPEATYCFTLTGCVGMTGLTSWGLGMTINNLNSNDARVGVCWPALVRRCLRERTAGSAKDVIMQADIGSGHHYIVADEMDVFGVETSGQKKKIIQEGITNIHLHTNHALDAEMAETCWVYAGSSTYKRYENMETLGVSGFGQSASDIANGLHRFRIPRPSSNTPHDVATCGSFVMDLKNRIAYAGVGVPNETPLLRIRLQ